MSDGNDPSAQQPTPGERRPPAPRTPGDQELDWDSPGDQDLSWNAPGDQDLPWKATAERRDLWGPIQKPLEGKVHRPASTELSRPGRRNPLVSWGIPLLLGGLAGAATLVLGIGFGIVGPLLALAAAGGISVVAAGGSGLAISALGRTPSERPVLDAAIPDSTRTVLERILEATAETRRRTGALRPQATVPAATEVLDDVEALLTRIDALVGSEKLQSQRPSSGEVTMLEGMAARYVPDLVDATADTLGFLQTFVGSARQEALDNLSSIDRQLGVLSEGLEAIERDIVGGVSRSLEVHSEFLRARFADQHLDPIIDV